MYFKSIEPQAETQLRKFENVANLRFKAQNYRVEIREITPDQARKWLEFNEGNRKVRRPLINFLINQLKTGKWALTGETICFDPSGNLLDGQHRLYSIAESGIAAPCFVVWGVVRDAQNVMDTGIVRGFQDVISMNYPDTSDPSGLGGAIKFILLFQRGYFPGGLSERSTGTPGHKNLIPDNIDVLTFLDNNPEFFGFYEQAKKIYLSGDRTLARRGFIAMWWILSDYGAKESDEFFTKLSTGVGLTATDPIHIFRSILIREKTSSDAAKYTRTQRIFGLIHTWNKFVLGERLKVFRIPKQMPEILSA